MSIYTEGIYQDGAVILKDGAHMKIKNVIAELNSAAGNVRCDYCGEYILPDDERFGFGCDLCVNCAEMMTDHYGDDRMGWVCEQ